MRSPFLPNLPAHPSLIPFISSSLLLSPLCLTLTSKQPLVDFSVPFPSLIFFLPSHVNISSSYQLFLLPPRHTRSPETLWTTYLSPPLSFLSASPLSSSLLWPPVAQMLWHMPLHVHAITQNISQGWKYACGGAHL